MTDLSIFAARVRDYIAICADELASEHWNDPAFQNHAEIEFNGMALMLFTLQFNRNLAYRQLCEARKVTPGAVNHWTEIPAVPTSAFKELELSSLHPEERMRVFHSSGTTMQTPSRHFHSTESLELYENSLFPWFRFHVQSGKNLAILTPPPAQAPNSSLVHMFGTIRKNFGAAEASFLGTTASDGAWTLNFDATIRALESATKSYEPLVILGTAFSFVHLVDHLAEKNFTFKLPLGSVVMETGGYKNRSRSMPKAELHALISQRLGVAPEQILCEYGMSELSSQAYDRNLGASASRRLDGAERTGKMPALPGVFRFPPWARAQIISPENGREVADGETGLIRIFDLANTFSVMAIQTEDLAIRRGSGFELLGRAESSEPRGCSLMSQSPIQ